MRMWLSTILFFVVADTSAAYWAKSECSEQELKYDLLPTPARSKFVNQILAFQVSDDVKLGELVTNYANQTLSVTVTQAIPRKIFKGETYLSIEVIDSNGTKVYEMSVNDKTNLSHHDIPMTEGDVIQIYHVVPAMLYSQEDIVDITNTTNRWLVTRYGLKNLRLRNDPLYDFVQRLDHQSRLLLGSILSFFESEDAQHLLIAIRALPQPYRSLHLMRYSSIFPTCIVQPLIDNNIYNNELGSLEIYLKQHVNNLMGTIVQIKHGEAIIVEDIIYENIRQLHFESIPFGVYSVEFRGRSVEEYVISPQYVEVKRNVNFVEFDFVKINCSMYMDQSIEFYGLGQKLFGTLRASYEEGSIIVTVVNKAPHVYFKNNNYAIIEVTTGQGVSKYKNEIKGANNDVIMADIIPLLEGDVIKVYHREGKTRLRSKDVVIDESIRQNKWLVTKYGLQNWKLKNDPLDEVMKTIDKKASVIVTSAFKYGKSFYISEEKKQLLAAIRSLPDSHRLFYRKKYRALFPKIGGTFSVSFKADYSEELAGRVIRIENERFGQDQSVQGDVVTFTNLPYGYYSIKVPE